MNRLLFILLFAWPLLTVAQKKDCKFVKYSDPNASAKESEMMTMQTSEGQFMLIKSDGKNALAYMSGVSLASSVNQVTLKIDSVLIIFADNSSLFIKAQGIGTTPNTPQIKPKFVSMTFGFEITEDQLRNLQTKEITAFQVTGEKESQGLGGLTKKQSINLMKGFTCLN